MSSHVTLYVTAFEGMFAALPGICGGLVLASAPCLPRCHHQVSASAAAAAGVAAPGADQLAAASSVLPE